MPLIAYVGEIAMFGGDFAPLGWATCDGQILPISQNTALFALLGTTYGGNGTSTFALPYLAGCVPIGQGQGSGLSRRDQGEMSGQTSISLLQSEIPFHSHPLNARSDTGEDRTPQGEIFAKVVGGRIYGPANGPQVTMAPEALGPAGGTAPHNNMMPSLALNFVIAIQGEFPRRP